MPLKTSLGLCQFAVLSLVNKLFSPVSAVSSLISIVAPKDDQPPVESSKVVEEIPVVLMGRGLSS